MKTRLAAALAGLGLALAAGLAAVAAPAAATETQPEPVCEATWKMKGWDGTAWTGQPEGSSVTKTSAKLVKPQAANESVQPGVEFAAFDLEIQAPADNEIHVGVKYELAGGASVTGTAVRMFGYKAQNADSENVGPDWKVTATSETGGTLVLTIPAGEKLGTLGLTYDGSNSAKGSVTFSDMEIDGRPVWFTACPEPEPTVTATPTAQPTQTATLGPTATPTAQPTQTATPGPVTCSSFATQAEAQAAFDADPEGLPHLDADNDGKACEWGTATPEPTQSAAPVPTLPVTGSSSLGWFALAGLAALGSGALLFVLARRRRTTFTA